MRHYQFFPFNADGRLLDAIPIDLDNDAHAIRRAIDPEFPNGCELWEGFRFVGRFHGAAVKAVAPAPVEPAALVH
jgi:hypothetical protein